MPPHPLQTSVKTTIQKISFKMCVCVCVSISKRRLSKNNKDLRAFKSSRHGVPSNPITLIQRRWNIKCRLKLYLMDHFSQILKCSAGKKSQADIVETLESWKRCFSVLRRSDPLSLRRCSAGTPFAKLKGPLPVQRASICLWHVPF